MINTGEVKDSKISRKGATAEEDGNMKEQKGRGSDKHSAIPPGDIVCPLISQAFLVPLY